MVNLIGEYSIPNLTVKVIIIDNYSKVSGLNFNILGVQNPFHKIGTLKKLEKLEFAGVL